MPKAAVHRVSNALSNTCLLDFGPEYTGGINVPFALVTYGHKGFNFSFVALGFPKPDYSGWEQYWEITDKISKEVAVEILKNKEPVLREEYQEKITKKYDVKLKGE